MYDYWHNFGLLLQREGLFKKKYLYFGKTQNEEVNHWVLQPDPPPLSDFSHTSFFLKKYAKNLEIICFQKSTNNVIICSPLKKNYVYKKCFFLWEKVPKKHIKNLLKSGHCPEGGVPGLAQIAWSTFFHQLKDLGTSHKGGGL